MSFAAMRMDLETIIWTEVSQAEKEKYHIISLMSRNLKSGGGDTNELIYKTETELPRSKINLLLPESKGVAGRINLASLSGKESACNAGDTCSKPGWRRSAWEITLTEEPGRL